jgi:hypothetical protein
MAVPGLDPGIVPAIPIAGRRTFLIEGTSLTMTTSEFCSDYVSRDPITFLVTCVDVVDEIPQRPYMPLP